jgi:hypothetical protein
LKTLGAAIFPHVRPEDSCVTATDLEDSSMARRYPTLKEKLMGLCVAVGMLVTAVPALAHHAFGSEFDAKQPITLKGSLTKMEWSNPHGWIFIDVKGSDGTVVNWAVEFGPPNALMRRGLRKTDFAFGTEIVVDGYRAKGGSPTVNGKTVKFADGRDFFVGSAGTGAPEDEPKNP